MRLVACLAAILLGAPPDTVRVQLPADQPVELQVGRRLELVVAGNPTTGYRWSLVSAPDGLRSLGDPDYVQDPADTPDGRRRLGVGGRFIFAFVAEKATEGVVRLAYRRPWEKDTPPIDTAEVRVRVLAPR